jgi:energy-coupling factor transporter transmembrane protein EcfT
MLSTGWLVNGKVVMAFGVACWSTVVLCPCFAGQPAVRFAQLWFGGNEQTMTAVTITFLITILIFLLVILLGLQLQITGSSRELAEIKEELQRLADLLQKNEK